MGGMSSSKAHLVTHYYDTAQFFIRMLFIALELCGQQFLLTFPWEILHVDV